MLSVFFFNIAPKKIVLCNVTSSPILVNKGYDGDVSPSHPPPPSNPSLYVVTKYTVLFVNHFIFQNCKRHSVLDIFYVFLRGFFSSTDEQRASDDNGNLIALIDRLE